MAKNRYDKEKEEREKAKKAQQQILKAYKEKVAKSKSSSPSSKVPKVDTSKVGTYNTVNLNRDKKANRSYTKKETTTSTSKKTNLVAPLSNATKEEQVTAAYKKKYEKARANNDIVGMRAANLQANAARRAAGLPTYDSGIGDAQFANSRKIALPTQKAINSRVVKDNTSQSGKPQGFSSLKAGDLIRNTNNQQSAINQGMARNIKTNAGVRAYKGWTQGLNPIYNMERQFAERYGEDALKSLQNSKAYAGGQIGGEMTRFAIAYAMLGGGIGAGLSNIPKVANMGKVGQAVTKSLATDLAVDSIMQPMQVMGKEGKRGKEAAKEITKNTAIDMALGAGLEGAAGLIGKRLKSGKIIKSVEDVKNLTPIEKQEIMPELEKIEYQSNLRTSNNPTIEETSAKVKQQGKQYDSTIQISKKHTEEQKNMIHEYQKSVDEPLLQFVKKIEGLVNKNVASKLNLRFGKTNSRQIRDIQRVTGVNVTGYEHNINGSAINHINKRHGINGANDTSMQKAEDIARIKYVTDNYDSIEPLMKNDIDTELLKAFRNYDGTYALGVKYKKRINGNYYVVEAVPDSSAKKLQVISAYINANEKGAPRVLNMAKAPQPTSETLDESAPIKEILYSNDVKVNTSTSGRNNMRSARVAELTAQYAEVKKLKQVATDIEKSQKLTDREKEMVQWLLHGEVSADNLPPDVRRNAVIDVYMAKKAQKDAEKRLNSYNIERKKKLQNQMNILMAESDNFKDKRGFLYSRETAERNIIDIAGKKNGEKIIKNVFEPIHNNEANSTRMKNEYRSKIKDLNLSQKKEYSLSGIGTVGIADLGKVSESTLVQLLGEKKISIGDIKLIGADSNKIQNAVFEMRKIYNELLEKGNEVLVLNGYEPIPFRKDYFPHFTDNKPDNVLGKLANKLGFNIQTDELPTDIAGLTHTFRPGKKWFGHALQRQGKDTVYDAVQGFDMYLEGISDVIHHTDDIQRLRALETATRHKYSDAGIQERVNEVFNNPNIAEEEKQTIINNLYDANPHTKLNNFVQWIREYTDNLAGKKSLQDRIIEKELGRTTYNICKSLEGRVAANMVAVNPASWLTNFIPLFQGTEVSTLSSLKALGNTLKSYIKDDGFRNTSNFLINRRGSDTLYKTAIERLSKTLSAPMSYIDDFTTEVLTRAKYYDSISKGMKHEEAMNAADRFTAQVVGDRSKGALPTVFNQKNPMTKLLTMFQVEVNNQLSYLFKDIPRNMKEAGKFQIANSLAKYAVGAYIFNDVYEKLTGRRPALDGLGMLNEFFGESIGYSLPNTVDAITGENRTLKKEPKGLTNATANLGANLAENTPFIGGLLGGGRIPISSALPNISNTANALTSLASGEKNKKKALNMLGKEFAKPAAYILPPVGGGQLKKFAEGAKLLKDGGSYTINNNGEKELQFSVDPDAKTAAQALIFGKYSSAGGQAYIKSNFDRLSAKQTQMYEALRSAGYANTKAEEAIRQIADLKKVNEKRDSILNLDTDAKTKQQLGNIIDGEQKYDYSSKENYDFSRLTEAQQEKYIENLSDIQKAYYTKAMKTLSENSKNVTTQAGKALLLMESNEYGQKIAEELYSEKQVKKAQAINELGISAEQYEDIRKSSDIDKSGQLTKAETIQGIESRTDLTDIQKAYMKKIMLQYR